MNPLTLALVVLLAVHEPVRAQPLRTEPSGFDKFLRQLFQPAKKKPPAKRQAKIKHNREKTKPKQASQRIETMSVSPEWMAHYWELAAAWDYPIPKDDEIKWKDGKYVVPFEVVIHYEDMANTPRRTYSNH